jgi:hypothetical protein
VSKKKQHGRVRPLRTGAVLVYNRPLPSFVPILARLRRALGRDSSEGVGGWWLGPIERARPRSLRSLVLCSDPRPTSHARLVRPSLGPIRVYPPPSDRSIIVVYGDCPIVSIRLLRSDGLRTKLLDTSAALCGTERPSTVNKRFGGSGG